MEEATEKGMHKGEGGGGGRVHPFHPFIRASFGGHGGGGAQLLRAEH